MTQLDALRGGALAGAARLDLPDAGLTKFPREILDLADSLEILNLSGNRLRELPDDLPRLRKLRILFCSGNDFRSLPGVLGECPTLEMVGFKSCGIEAVDSAAFPPNLRWLILTDNRLASLPPSIGRCARLQKLMLAGNRLSRLPDEMAGCRMLELIRLSANRFEVFPDWLFELPRLAWLGLAGNPASAPVRLPELPEIPWADLRPQELLGEGASGVIHAADWHAGNEDAPRAVAVKVFKGGMTSDGLPEHELTACLAAGEHPHLIGVLGRVADHPCGHGALVMRRIDDGFVNLAGPPDFDSCTRDVFADGHRFDAAGVLRMAIALCSAAAHLHDRGIAHGDLYAHNILRNGDNDCLLGDFGAASFYPQGAALERIEVRAFGCLLEELLERADFAAEDKWLEAALSDLQARCVADDVKSRPRFAEIMRYLADLPPQCG